MKYIVNYKSPMYHMNFVQLMIITQNGTSYRKISKVSEDVTDKPGNVYVCVYIYALHELIMVQRTYVYANALVAT